MLPIFFFKHLYNYIPFVDFVLVSIASMKDYKQVFDKDNMRNNIIPYTRKVTFSINLIKVFQLIWFSVPYYPIKITRAYAYVKIRARRIPTNV